jgi:hypothetical protein
MITENRVQEDPVNANFPIKKFTYKMGFLTVVSRFFTLGGRHVSVIDSYTP